VDAGRPRFEADRTERDALAGRFLEAFREGDVRGLTELLAADVQLVGDGGGKGPQWADQYVGTRGVARVLTVLVELFSRIGARLEPHEVNGRPGAIFRDRNGKVLNVWALEIADGQVRTIHAVTNPDKLGHLGLVADGWAALREARRPTVRSVSVRSRSSAGIARVVHQGVGLEPG
jgi:RNA polymerase sigma-70 factor (ECF subfamily)